MQKFKSDARKNRVSSWFDLETDYDKLLAFAHKQAAAGSAASGSSAASAKKDTAGSTTKTTTGTTTGTTGLTTAA